MKTTPKKHQLEVYEKTKDEEFYGYFLEQGLGKTKITLDVAFHLHESEKLDNVLVLAPNGVHLNWLYSELPKHGWGNYKAAAWKSTLRRKEKRALEEILKPSPELRFLFANIESVRTKAIEVLIKFIRSGRTMVVVDESTIIKNPKAMQTKRTLQLGNIADFRRILTGTPVTQGPLDLFTQCRFLSPTALPITSYTAFKHTFAVEQNMIMGQRSFNKVVGYKNLDYLEELLKPISIRLTKEDCLDLPPKIYQRHYVELSSEQERTYQSIKETQVALLEKEEQEQGVVSVTSALTALIKLHQICCGFIVDDGGEIHDLQNNRYKALEYLTQDETRKYVIWTTYKHTVREICRKLKARFGEQSVVHYYGETSADDRVRAVERFQNESDCRFFVANRAASKGLTLTAANQTIFFACSYSLEDRLQEEDRVHRIGQQHTCLYTDILSPDTVEERILAAVESKKEMSDKIITSDWRTLIR